ncbi:MAG: sodium:solute symporter family protein [Desulfobacterales bacterium]|nr:sodium:solute symporter family protein [Desulfobacterales bacterium]
MEGTYEFSNWVLMGLVVYMAVMLFVGWYASKKIETTEDYVVAGRRLGVFFCTGTLFATWFGAGTCMGGAGNAYLFGNQGVIFDPWAAALCLVLLGFFFARLVRRGKYITTVDLFETRFGRKMGLWSAIILAIGDIGWLASLLVGFGTVLHYFAGIPLTTGIVISSVIVIIYTYLGGMWAVTLTDVFQMIILIVGLVAMLIVAVPLVGGLDSIFTNDPNLNWCGINQWSFIPTPESAADPDFGNAGFFYYTGHQGWFYWLAAWLSIAVGSFPFQSLMQRVFSAKDEKTAAMSGYCSGLLYITVGMIPVLLGMIYFQLNPDLGVEDAMNKILLLMATEYLHPVFAVIFVVALVAAIMSSSDSTILSSSSLLGYNGYKYFKKNATEKDTLRMIKRLVPIVGTVALIIALYFQVIYNLMVIVGTVVLVGLSVPFICAYFFKKANNYGALASLFGGVITWVVCYFIYLPYTMEMETGILEEGVVYFEWAMWDALYIASIWAVAVSLICMIVVSLTTQKIDPPRPLVDVDGNLMSTKQWMGLFGGSRDKNVISGPVSEEK